MEELKFTNSEYVVEMGAVADAIYFVKEGELVCHTASLAPRHTAPHRCTTSAS